MLRCQNLTVRPPADASRPPLLKGVSAAFKTGAMNAIIGPSGSGKTMLVKALLGLVPADPDGEIWLGSQRVARPEDLLGQVGFAPQFSIAQPKLTVDESLRYALELTVDSPDIQDRRRERILQVVGLAEHRDKHVESLSGGQLRRLGLGLELTIDPPTLVCDEVTSGLDPMSEEAILNVLRELCQQREKTILAIIHNLGKLEHFDWITVISEGHVVFQGTLQSLHAHFGILDALHLYDALNSQPLEHWLKRWREEAPNNVLPAPPPKSASEEARKAVANPRSEVPNGTTQFFTLLRRRFLLLLRDHGYLILLLGVTFGFPVMVVIFALDGLPQISSLAMEPAGISPEALRTQAAHTLEAAQTAGLVTSLIMFQVILLALMGANNGAREIAGERLLYEKERLLGVRPAAYAASKLVFAGLVAAFQGAWMMFFVNIICRFPGFPPAQLISLVLTCVAMTWVCLGFSAWMTSPEKANTLSIYLVGFQLPLSGVVLALPAYLVWIFRPFISAYWGWAGYFDSMENEKIFDAYTLTNVHMYIAPTMVAVSVLLVHALCGAAAVWRGCERRRWTA